MAKATKKPAKKAATKSPSAKKKATITKKKITNLIIIDASGSMIGKKEEVKGGLKQLFSSIKSDMQKDSKKVIMRNIVLDFSNSGDIRTLVDSTDVNMLDDNIADNYTTRGLTALLDAIGRGLSMVDKNEYAVFVNILTDGEENDSKEYNSTQISKMIEEAKNKKWAVTFMGTTEASIQKARSLGVTVGNTMTFADTRDGVALSMKKSLSARANYYSAVTDRGIDNLTLESLDNTLVNAKDDKLNDVNKKQK